MKAGLYIHIPFCRQKCRYCDFYSMGGRQEVPREYIQAVKREISRWPDLECKTVYFGGGTPSLLTANQVDEILSCLNILPGAEITMEANPESLTYEKRAGYRRAGVNRLSIGVQSAYDKSLHSLGRLHTAAGAADAFRRAKKAGFDNISGDLMIGLDNYTAREMLDTIDFLKDRGAVHISAYMLKIEKGTDFYINPPAHLSDEEQLADFYLMAREKLEKEGYHQYEISNFAKDGRYSRHNMIYWQLEDYLGIGPGAHSCINGQRFHYPRDLAAFLSRPQTEEDGKTDADEYIMLSLRLASGLSVRQLAEKWGLKIGAHTTAKLKVYRENDFLTFDGDNIKLTPKGFLAENTIARDIMSDLYDI